MLNWRYFKTAAGVLLNAAGLVSLFKVDRDIAEVAERFSGWFSWTSGAAESRYASLFQYAVFAPIHDSIMVYTSYYGAFIVSIVLLTVAEVIFSSDIPYQHNHFGTVENTIWLCCQTLSLLFLLAVYLETYRNLSPANFDLLSLVWNESKGGGLSDLLLIFLASLIYILLAGPIAIAICLAPTFIGPLIRAAYLGRDNA